MTKNVFLIINFILFCFIHQKILACECRVNTFSIESGKADLIFRGVVINRKEDNVTGKILYNFKINQVWKGNHYNTITIRTNYGGPDCGAIFYVGKEYVVYTNNFETDLCKRNAEISSISSDVQRLNFKYNLSYRQQILFDTSELLSNHESDYFNSIFNNLTNTNIQYPKDVDFSDKKILFYKDSLLSKQEYFELYGDQDPKMYFEKLSNNEIAKSGGYYGIICLKEKGTLKKRQKRILIRMSNLLMKIKLVEFTLNQNKIEP